MPSKNSVNMPKSKSKFSNGKRKQSTVSRVTSSVISKKRAKKDLRNAKYLEEYVKERAGLIDDDAMMDTEEMSATQRKVAARKLKIEQQNALNLTLEADLPAEEVLLSASGQGTTLGKPPVY